MKKKLIKKHSNEFPSAKEMKDFCNSFEEDAWKFCIQDREFLNLVTVNLNRAAERAFKILAEIA